MPQLHFMAKGLAWPSMWNHEVVSSITTSLTALPGIHSVNYLSARHLTTIGLGACKMSPPHFATVCSCYEVKCEKALTTRCLRILKLRD